MTNCSPAIPVCPEKAPASNRELPAAAGAVAFTVFVWALSFPLNKIALAEIAPLPLAAARFLVASFVVLAWLAWKRPAAPTRGDVLRFLLCGLIGIALYNGLLNSGQRSVSASAASFIVNTVPVLTALISTILLNERFTKWGWTGMIIGFCGVGVIISGQSGGLSFGSGAILIFGAAIAQAAFFLIQKPLVSRYGALASTAYTMIAGTLLLLPWLGEGLGSLSHAATPHVTIPVVIALGVFPAALGYAAWNRAIAYFGAARASTFLYLVPAVATVLAFAISGELPGLSTLAGGLIAIAGVALVGARGRPKS